MPKFREKVKARRSEEWCQRLGYCVSILYLHDFINDSERMRIHKRMMKYRAKETAKGNV